MVNLGGYGYFKVYIDIIFARIMEGGGGLHGTQNGRVLVRKRILLSLQNAKQDIGLEHFLYRRIKER